MQNYQKNLKRALLTDNTIMLWNDGYVTAQQKKFRLRACMSMPGDADGYHMCLLECTDGHTFLVVAELCKKPEYLQAQGY